jgi:predicted RNA-binding Zn-ribbon protein involved in translation (DUF1610 family)
MPASSPEPPPSTPRTQGASFFPCSRCGAKLEYAPGTTTLTCPYCSTENQIPADERPVARLDFAKAIADLDHGADKAPSPVVTCTGCHATITLASNITSLECPFCGASIVATGASATLIKPNAVLPFKIPREQATAAFRTWIRSRWFAPGALKRRSMLDATLTGLYLPAWTYDCRAHTVYTGERGDAYYETERVMVNGRSETRQVRRIRWSPASGSVENEFSDVLVTATNSMPEHQLEQLEPWDLTAAVPYSDSYLAGFRTECYQIDLKQGFQTAQELMEPEITESIQADIGGDEQRIHNRSTSYSGITFKHLLLPVWMSAYRYDGRVYQFLVNARTGEVQGRRPYSAVKITLTVLVALAVIAIAIFFASRG